MNMTKLIFRYELLQLFRNKFLAIPLFINLLCWGYIIISYEIQPIHYEERAAAFYQGFMWLLLLNLLMIGLFAVYMADKDRENKFESLIVTYQVKNAEWIIGKWLVTQTYALGITLITLLVQISWLLLGKISFGDLVKNVLYVFVQMEGGLILLISLGFLFGILLKNMFAYIFIPAILLLTLGLPFDYTGVALTFDNPRVHLLTPFDYMFIQSPYESIWGIDRVFGTTILHQFIVLLLGGIFILVTILLFRSNRRVQREKKIIPVLIATLLIPTIILSGIRYVQYDQAFKQYVTTGEHYVTGFEGRDEKGLAEWEWENSYYDTYLDNTKYEFSVEQMNLSALLKTDNSIKVRSQLTIKHNGDAPVKDVYLTLQQALNVTECSSKSVMTCSRESDFVIVHFDQMIEPGEQFNVNLAYNGSVLQYRDEGYVEHSFIQNHRVYLPKEAGWYPLIGKRQLVIAREHNNNYVQFELRNARLVEDYPTEFTVEIMNEDSNIPLALTIPEVEAGIYSGTSLYGLSLVGGNLEEVKVGQTRIVGHPEILNGAKNAVKKNQQAWKFIEDWLDIPMTPSVIYILNDEHYYLTRSTPSQEFLIWHAEGLEYVDDSIIAYEIVEYLTNEYASWENEDVRLLGLAMEWSITSHLHEMVGLKNWYVSTWGIPSEVSEVPEPIDVLNGYEDRSKEEFNTVVKFLYTQYKQLDDKSIFDMEAALQKYEGVTNE
ncbi:ABC transporter permease [Lederbergia lenta]|uniref:ABC-type transport system involved in multi-copper enzyme maturation, permease component n=1 Tax=Lederbergia lenta TaxID=1467 RepID=A0A2X4W8Q0_LEDLE|nr:ABC transporter permease [Lederbergia lenta]MEC2324602.1 ABC transporter permease [Lederbergia lenta]SQI59373.1 ABC-type transport system involved in multi-copper enzyme maturation, permease component [Lederbergia lenta]